MLGTAPAGTVTALLRIQLIGNGGSNPIMFFTKTAIGKAPPNATEVGEWAPGGVTDISGGQLRSNSVTAEVMAANSIESDSIVANAVVFGKVAAGAIRASEIFGGEIRAVHLASEEIISDSIQVRNLVVGTNKIIGDAVTTLVLSAVYHGGAGGSGAYVVANNAGFFLTDARSGVISVTWTQGYYVTPLVTQIRIDLDYVAVREFATNAVANYNTITVPVNLAAGSHNVTVYWYGETGNALLYECDVTVLVRAR